MHKFESYGVFNQVTILDKFNLDNKLNNNPDINLFTNLNPTILNQITDCKFKVSFLEF